jgi:hypothetical protein
MLLVARSQLVSQRQTLANTIRGLLKTFCSATIWMDVSGDQDEICGFAWG